MDDRNALPGIKPASRDMSRWNKHLTGWVAVKALPGSDWWALDDVVQGLPGRKPVARTAMGATWHAIPADSLEALGALLDAHPGRFQLRSL